MNVVLPPMPMVAISSSRFTVSLALRKRHSISSRAASRVRFSLLEVLAQERQEDLVEPSQGVGNASVVEHHPQVNEPDGLERLPEAARRLGRNPAADLGDLQQLASSPGVALFASHLAGEARVTRGEAQHAVAGDRSGAQEPVFLLAFRAGGVEPGHALLDPPADPPEPQLDEPRVIGGAVSHAVGELVLDEEHRRPQGFLRLGRKQFGAALPRPSCSPERQDLGAENGLVFLGDVELLELLAGAEEIELGFDPGGLHLGKER